MALQIENIKDEKELRTYFEDILLKVYGSKKIYKGAIYESLLNGEIQHIQISFDIQLKRWDTDLVSNQNFEK